jgi:hypothetical protein
MFGNALEIFTASLTIFGPLTNPESRADLQLNLIGTALNSSSNFGGPCIIEGPCDLGELEDLKIIVNTSGTVFKSADITFTQYDSTVDGLGGGITDFVIGPNGDSVNVSNFYGVNVLSVSSAAPGRWFEVPVSAPELDAASLGSALALLGGSLLVLRGRRST